MKGCLYHVFSLSCVLALLGGDVLARSNYSSGYAATDGWKDESYINNSGDDYRYGGGYSKGSNNGFSNKEEDYYPFIKSNGRIENKDVIGVRLLGDKVILLSGEGESREYSEGQSQQSDFSDFDVFSKYPRLLSVEFCNIELTKDVLQNVKKFLPKTVKSLIINSCSVATKDFDELTDIISGHEQLVSVTAVLPKLAQAEAEQLIKSIGDLNNTKFLNLTLGELGKGGCTALREVIEKSEKTLLGLNLGFVRVDDSESYNDMLDSLGKLKNLNKLEYSVLESTEEQVGRFFSSLAKLEKLTDLKLCFDDFNSHDGVESYHNAEGLGEAMRNLTALENLDISNMKLPDSSLQTISKSMEDLTKLKTLNISGDPVSVKTARVLSESLAKMENLVTFIANDCEMTGEAFSALCGGFRNNSALKCISVSGNKIENSVRSLQVSQLKNLSMLNVAYNNIKLPDIVGFMKTIPSETSLEVISWKGNNFEGLSEEERIAEVDSLKIWKRQNRINTLDLGI